MNTIIMENTESIFIIKKNGTGGVLEYQKSVWDRNKNARNEYREANKEEIEKYFTVEPIESEPIQSLAIESQIDGERELVENQLDEDVKTKRISKSKKE